MNQGTFIIHIIEIENNGVDLHTLNVLQKLRKLQLAEYTQYDTTFATDIRGVCVCMQLKNKVEEEYMPK